MPRDPQNLAEIWQKTPRDPQNLAEIWQKVIILTSWAQIVKKSIWAHYLGTLLRPKLETFWSLFFKQATFFSFFSHFIGVLKKVCQNEPQQGLSGEA